MLRNVNNIFNYKLLLLLEPTETYMGGWDEELFENFKQLFFLYSQQLLKQQNLNVKIHITVRLR